MEKESRIKKVAGVTAASVVLALGLSSCEAEPQNNGSVSTSEAPATTSILPIPESSQLFEQALSSNTIIPLVETVRKHLEEPNNGSITVKSLGGEFATQTDPGYYELKQTDGNETVSIVVQLLDGNELEINNVNRVTARLVANDGTIPPNSDNPQGLRTVWEVDAFQAYIEDTTRWDVVGQHTAADSQQVMFHSQGDILGSAIWNHVITDRDHTAQLAGQATQNILEALR